MNNQLLKVLIVESSRMRRTLFGLYATKAGFNYTVCDSPEVAIAAVKRAKP